LSISATEPFDYDHGGGGGGKFMPDRPWYVVVAEKQYGPFFDERFRPLIPQRQVAADTFLLCSGTKDWGAAGGIPGPMPATRPPGPPMRTAAPAEGSADALAMTAGVWPLFGRMLLLSLSFVVVIPIPWAVVNFLRWFVDHIELPGQQRVSFAGKVGDIWPI